MKALCTLQLSDGTYPQTGTTYRSVVSDLRTERGVIRRMSRVHGKCPFKIEFYTNSAFMSGAPYRIYYQLKE